MSTEPNEQADLKAKVEADTRVAERLIGHAVVMAAIVTVAGAILANSFYHSVNDGSRWNTVWNLVHRGTYALDGGPWGDKQIIFRRKKDGREHPEPHIEGPWATIDMVRWECRHEPGTCWIDKAGDRSASQPVQEKHDGPAAEKDRHHYYSSKPPLLSTLVAGAYYVLWHVTDLIDGEPGDYTPTGNKKEDIKAGNGWQLAYFTDDAAGNPNRRLKSNEEIIKGQAAGRTLLLLVNVLPFAVFLHLYRRLLERSTYGSHTKIFCLIVAAFGTYLTAYSRTFNNHVVAAFAAFIAIYCALRILYGGQRQARYFLGAGLFAALAASTELPALALLAVTFVCLLFAAPRQTLLFFVPMAILPVAGFFATNQISLGFLKPAQVHIYTENETFHDLYHFEGSYWNHATGIDDLGEDEPRWLYLTHMLVGHHGIFALSPVLLLALLGLFQHLFNREYGLRAYHGLALLVTVAVLAFYVWRTNNYGGGAQGLRWTFWLIPLWLVALPRGVETVLRSRVGAVIAMGFLGVSVFSMAFALTPSTGPWSQSWLHYLLQQANLVAY